VKIRAIRGQKVPKSFITSSLGKIIRKEEENEKV